jgi:predicted Na+-dependent transporter
VIDVETVYGVLLISALLLNGVAITASTPLRSLLAPLREGGLITRIMLLDVVLVPIVAVLAANALGVDPVTRAAIVIVAAASTGPIGMALTRIARGDVPLSVTLVVLLGALNLITVPLVTELFLPSGITIPLSSLLSSLLGLAVAPLVLGRLLAVVLERSRSGERTVRTMRRIAQRGSDVLLLGAVSVALFIEPRAVFDAFLGPVTIVAVVVVLVVAVGARVVTSDAARVRTLAVVLNARAVGLALTVATIHLGTVEGLRATILAYGGLTQIVPLAVVLLLRRRSRGPLSDPTSRTH